MSFAEFRPLFIGAGLSEKEVWLLYRSFQRIFFFKLVDQKKFEGDFAAAIKYQKGVLKQIAKNCSGPIKKLILDILLDETKFEANNFGKNVSPLTKHRALLKKRIGRYELFFQFSDSDKERLDKIALRLERKRDKVSTKTAWRYGLGIAAAIAAGATLYKLSKDDEKK